MAESLETKAKRTRRLRFTVYALIQQGATEPDALIKATPGDSNRNQKLRSWKTSGLWPVSDAEIHQYPDLWVECQQATVGLTTNPFAAEPRKAEPEQPKEEPTSEEDRAEVAQPEAAVYSQDAMDAIVAKLDAFDQMQHEMREMRRMLLDTIERSAREKVVAKLQTILQEPPLPERKPGSKAFTDESQRIRLAGTIPTGLMDTFEEDRRRRGKNVSQMLEFVLFNFYREHPLKDNKFEEDNLISEETDR